MGFPIADHFIQAPGNPSPGRTGKEGGCPLQKSKKAWEKKNMTGFRYDTSVQWVGLSPKSYPDHNPQTFPSRVTHGRTSRLFSITVFGIDSRNEPVGIRKSISHACWFMNPTINTVPSNQSCTTQGSNPCSSNCNVLIEETSLIGRYEIETGTVPGRTGIPC